MARLFFQADQATFFNRPVFPERLQAPDIAFGDAGRAFNFQGQFFFAQDEVDFPAGGGPPVVDGPIGIAVGPIGFSFHQNIMFERLAEFRGADFGLASGQIVGHPRVE